MQWLPRASFLKTYRLHILILGSFLVLAYIWWQMDHFESGTYTSLTWEHWSERFHRLPPVPPRPTRATRPTQLPSRLDSESVTSESGTSSSSTTLRESRGEVECRRVLETLFGHSFPKLRPEFLANPVTGQRLELDCFCPALQLACEYNGIQHYEYSPHFHSSRDAFRNQQYRDHLKQEACRANHVRLIVVPYTVPIAEIESYILEKLRAMEIPLPRT